MIWTTSSDSRGLQVDWSTSSVDPVLGGLDEVGLELRVIVFQAGDDHDGGGKPADDVAQGGQRASKPCRGPFQVEHIFKLIDTENQGNPLQSPDQLAETLDDPVGGVGVGARDDSAQELSIVGCEVLAPQIFQDPCLDPGIIALEIQQGLRQENIDRLEPIVDDDSVRQFADEMIERLLVQVLLAELTKEGCGRVVVGDGFRPVSWKAASVPCRTIPARNKACRATRPGY